MHHGDYMKSFDLDIIITFDKIYKLLHTMLEDYMLSTVNSLLHDYFKILSSASFSIHTYKPYILAYIPKSMVMSHCCTS